MITSDGIIYEEYFPEETQVGTITIDGNRLIVKSTMAHEVNIDSLLYILAGVEVIDGKNEVSLHVVDQRTSTSVRKIALPCNFSGFRQAYKILSKKYSLDNQRFYQISSFAKSNYTSSKNEEVMIWRHNPIDSFTILSSYKDDVIEGFEIMAPSPVFVKWLTESRDLLKLHPELVTRKFPLQIIYPVRIGNILIKERFNYYKSKWQLELTLPFQGIECYLILEKALFNMLNERKTEVTRSTDPRFVREFKKSYGKRTFQLRHPLVISVLDSSQYFYDQDTTNFNLDIEGVRSGQMYTESDTERYRNLYGY